MSVYYETKKGILYHGDCNEIMQTLYEVGTKVDAVITDLPHNVKGDKWNDGNPFIKMFMHLNRLKRDKSTPMILLSTEPYSSELRMCYRNAYQHEWKFNRLSKLNLITNKTKPRSAIEDILVFSEKTPPYHPPKKNTNNFIEYAQNLVDTKTHPTKKAQELIEYLILTYTNEGDTVLDFTSGSGTLAIACEKLNRKWICIEIDEEYCKTTKEELLNNETNNS